MKCDSKYDEGDQVVGAEASTTDERLWTENMSNTDEPLDDLAFAPQAGLAERLIAIGKDSAARIPELYRLIDHGTLLYDEQGLPN